jgi:hypothetical protein
LDELLDECFIGVGGNEVLVLMSGRGLKESGKNIGKIKIF